MMEDEAWHYGKARKGDLEALLYLDIASADICENHRDLRASQKRATFRHQALIVSLACCVHDDVHGVFDGCRRHVRVSYEVHRRGIVDLHPRVRQMQCNVVRSSSVAMIGSHSGTARRTSMASYGFAATCSTVYYHATALLG